MTKSKLDLILSYVLKSGLFASILLIISGMILALWSKESSLLDYSVFNSDLEKFKSISLLFSQVWQGEGGAVIQLGVVTMILTPVLRVLACLLVFCYQRDYTYIGITSVVLAILIYSIGG